MTGRASAAARGKAAVAAPRGGRRSRFLETVTGFEPV